MVSPDDASVSYGTVLPIACAVSAVSALLLLWALRAAAQWLWRQRWCARNDRVWLRRIRAFEARTPDPGWVYTVARQPGTAGPPAPTLESLPQVCRELKESFNAGYSRPICVRRAQLKRLYTALLAREDAILDALHTDLGRPRQIAFVYDFVFPRNEIAHMLQHLDRLASPSWHWPFVVAAPSTDLTVPHPYGATLIMSPWNFPFLLSISPVAGALAAGNTLLFKPSVNAPACARVLTELIREACDPRIVQVVGPEVPETPALLDALLDAPWGHIFFTGSPQLGGKIREHAGARHIHVTLELGGKNPVFVDKTADIPGAVNRILPSRMINAGQQCIAPDYCLVHEDVVNEFLAECRRLVPIMYPEGGPDAGDGSVLGAGTETAGGSECADAPGAASGQSGGGGLVGAARASPRARGVLGHTPDGAEAHTPLLSGRMRTTPHIGFIVHDRSMRRLVRLLQTHGGETVVGGRYDLERRYIEPTVLRVDLHRSPAIQEEVFGPMLLVTSVPSMEAAIEYVRERPVPLCLYIFTQDASLQDELLLSTFSGGVSVNVCLYHSANARLPFGGVGQSGTGCYHGDKTFEAFSFNRAVLYKWQHALIPNIIKDIPLTRPPWSATKLRLLRYVM